MNITINSDLIKLTKLHRQSNVAKSKLTKSNPFAIIQPKNSICILFCIDTQLLAICSFSQMHVTLVIVYENCEKRWVGEISRYQLKYAIVTQNI